MHAVLPALAVRSYVVDGDAAGRSAAASAVDSNAGNSPADQPAATTASHEHPANEHLDAIEAEVSTWVIHSTTAQRVRSHVAAIRDCLGAQNAA